MADSLEPGLYRKIYKFIVRTPGVPITKIAEHLQLNLPIVEHYVSALEKNGKIVSLMEPDCVRYYGGKKRTRDRRTEEIHRKIFAVLQATPGIHLSKIAENLQMSTQLAEYHLTAMEKKNLIIGMKDEGEYYRRYYLKESEVGVQDKKMIALLRQEHLLRIVLLIAKYPNITHKKLLEHLNITPGTLSHHLNNLDEYGLIEVRTYGREKGYMIKNKKEVLAIIRRYIADVMKDRFADMWNDLNLKE